MLHPWFCPGDPALVHSNICTPHLWNGALSSVGPGFGLVDGGSGPRMDPRHGCIQADTRRRKLLEGGCDACHSIWSLLLMSGGPICVANVAALSAAIENTLLSQREMAPLPRC